MSVDHDLKKMMRDLGHALVHAIAASPEAADTVRQIRHRGYSLYLVSDRNEGAAISLSGGTRIELASGQPPSTKPGYLLNKGDVTFLESVGIDATRPGRRR